ncbi:helix-turn-helix domain-containing protein [Streptomyces olivochromogenes]|uniref:helix-turn-helix domain-containing protein n=1 Tax=Streptomyces olivochromogenes TaxID=1963 RepID=UPI001F4868F7|nr:helix-turn-helix transcriptional regulator [Streptomyces olivochromogenes]MCF3132480.1 helix-turn-helix transcriptional regulator [Streptomyces olivochromogenes]
MSTDYQSGRVSLGARMRDLRTEAGFDGKGIAERLGWQRSKVSRLENGKQTPSRKDLEQWADAVDRPDAAAELLGRLTGLETRYRSLRRQYANGHRARQEQGLVETEQTTLLRAVEVIRIPGLFQTPEYARAVFAANAAFRDVPSTDVEDAVRARMRRQQALYEPDRSFRVLLWEGALYALNAPREIMAAQLDRLRSMIGLDTVELGIIPFAAQLKRSPSHGFWIYDRRLVIVETLSTEMWLDDEESIALYERAWEWLAEPAVYGPKAHHLIGRASAALNLT